MTSAHRSSTPPPAHDTIVAPSSDEQSSLSGRRRLGALGAPILLGLVVDLVAVLACGFDAARLSRGMDVSWDLLNYHYYYSYLLFHGGIGQADPEPFVNRFLNPLPELPWYVFDQAFSPRWSSALIGLVAGCNLPLIRRITLRLLPSRIAPMTALLLSIAAMAIAAVGTDFRMEIGSSLADVVVSLPMLGALLLVLRAAQNGRAAGWWPYAIAGTLSGVAVGAKLTMACYLVALALAVLVLAALTRRFAFVLSHGVGVVAGMALASGWWFWSVWRATGNPIFPFYNSIFRSPDWSGGNLHDNRYGPHGVVDALKYPFYMLRGTHRVLDVAVRDPRWVVLLVLIALALVVLAAEVVRRRDTRALISSAVAARPILAFVIFTVVGSVIWLFQFGISRYAVVSEMLVGPAMVLLLLAVVRRPVIAAVAAVATAAAMFPFVQGYFYHVPFQRNRYMVQAAPLRQVPRDSVVLSDAGDAPSSFLLTYLPSGVKRHVVHPWFYHSPLLKKLQREELRPAKHIYVIEGGSYRKRAGELADALNLGLETGTCVPIHSSVQTRYLCEARWLGPPPAPAAAGKGSSG